MRTLKLITVFIMLVCLGLMFTSIAFAQEKEKTITIADILKKAQCPLSEEQSKKLADFKPGGDFEAFRTLNEVFDEKQTAALKEAFGTFPGFDGGPEQVRFLFFAVIFENEKQPLTESQLKKIKVLPEGPEAFEEMQTIFTPEQGEIMESMFNR